ncbi:MCP four helix bundle domain-containing protein [Polynucleobacter sp. UK-Mo-2m-Kol15]|uniref:MCP four helix bundle domain-containing protein n=1 Tax=Polynucleobacter sp. UK-Mo-2m-Kol15 TaxID=2576916 RepID=UPI001C0E1A30|nr:MCP four helix bundle domain-containing protein [Polynucleobacter sp. UK-Mo-2m-Kol15]MBU3575904.1 MCP four helix bundle domain-containing protein [Polynucleobacter sp. UK-Mo-2m-Kol15]
MSKIKLSANTPQFPSLLTGLANFSWNLPKIKLPTLSAKDSYTGIVGMVIAGYLVLMIIGAYGLYAYQNHAQSLYQNRLMTIKGLDDTKELVQKTDLMMKSAIYETSKGKQKSLGAIDGLIASNISKLSELKNANNPSLKGIQEKEVFDAFTSTYSEWINTDLKGTASAIIGNNIGLATQIYTNSGDMIAILDQNAKALIKIQYEEGRKEASQGKGYLYFFIFFGALISLCSIIAISYLLTNSKRMLDLNLGADPEKLLEAAGHVASGNLDFQINTRAGDHSSVLAAIKAIQEEFRLLLLDTEILNKSMSQGKNLGRRNIEQHQGEFQRLAQELNTSIDYSLGFGQESEKKYKEIARYFASTNEEIQDLLKTVQNKNLSQRLALSPDSESNAPAAITINYILDLVEDVLTKIRSQSSTAESAGEDIKTLQEKLRALSDEQRSIVGDSKNSLDKVTALNKTSARCIKSIQNRATEASKSIQAICLKMDTLHTKQLAVSNKSNKEVSVISPLDNISFTSLDSGNTSIIKKETKKSLTKDDIENIDQMTASLKQIFETLDGIAKDGSKALLNNAEQNSNLSASYSDLVKIDHTIQKSDQFAAISQSNEILNLKALASGFILKEDAERIEKERLEAEAKSAEKEENPKAKVETDWELF